jgi:hypothetical protein
LPSHFRTDLAAQFNRRATFKRLFNNFVCIRYLYILLNNTPFNAKNQAFAGLGSGEVEKTLVGLLKCYGPKFARTGQKNKGNTQNL